MEAAADICRRFRFFIGRTSLPVAPLWHRIEDQNNHDHSKQPAAAKPWANTNLAANLQVLDG
jgi:hypothetical protein